ncbi:MAG TPA: cytidine deaminase [Candidatus Coprenecus stercoravium]|uniref:Cytidine deaminase n=1 Tax=Candidatus Coprenecus stercoravium TaxID=2840735 RepID=A0A9D2GR50_9BACT|nr:cytidine deaminase [Candidatus Coprenecus stercoravium]
MAEKRLIVTYREYTSMDGMDEADRSLLESALDATSSSYAPYSGYHVGAAVLMSDGTIVKGSNQENSAYPSGLCAERTALFAAHAAYPELQMRALAVTACRDGRMVSEPAWPCGACRQVLAESQKRAGEPIRVIVGGLSRILVFYSVDDILPFSFEYNKKG